MDNLEILATLGTQYSGQRQTKHKFMAIGQWRQMRQMPHFFNGKYNLLKANKFCFFLKICLNSPPLPPFIETRLTAVIKHNTDN